MRALGTTSAWLLTRILVLWLLVGRESWVTGDVAYFAQSLAAVPDAGLGRTLVEYPLPGVVLVALPWLLAEWSGLPGAYAALVAVFALAADAAFTVLLVPLRRRRRRRAALAVWLLAVPLLGATTYARFDLVPGILAGVATAAAGPPAPPRRGVGGGGHGAEALAGRSSCPRSPPVPRSGGRCSSWWRPSAPSWRGRPWCWPAGPGWSRR